MMSLSVVPKLRLGEYKKPDFVPKLGVILLKQFFSERRCDTVLLTSKQFKISPL
jgi:hypothetical protein